MPSPSPRAAAPPGRFTAAEYAFAKAWELYAPGLCGWTVHCDLDGDGGIRALSVYPPLAYAEGFVLRREGAAVTVSWLRERRRTRSLRDALLLICPLPAAALEQVEQLALLPEPALL